jgi:uncharacterized protein DUF4386
MTRQSWLVPLTGLLFVVILIISFVVGGEPPDVDEGAAKIAEHYTDDKDSIEVGAFLSGLAAIFLVFFANYLRTIFQGTRAAATILVGAAIVAVAAGIDATLLFAMAETVEDVEPASIQTLQALWDNDFMPFMIGLAVFLASLGISIVRTAVLPKWLGWLTLVIALVSVAGPIGFFAFPATGLLIIVLSVWLTLRERRASAPPPAAPPPAPAVQ